MTQLQALAGRMQRCTPGRRDLDCATSAAGGGQDLSLYGIQAIYLICVRIERYYEHVELSWAFKLQG